MKLRAAIEQDQSIFRMYHVTLVVRSDNHLQFIDLTEGVQEHVSRSELLNGLVNLQTRHTTTGIVINENEPLLLDDLKRTLERVAPETSHYNHNDFDIRTKNMTPHERKNGHSHCRALLLPASQTLNLVNGDIQLGQWQRIFLAELDGPRERSVSLQIIGVGR